MSAIATTVAARQALRSAPPPSSPLQPPGLGASELLQASDIHGPDSLLLLLPQLRHTNAPFSTLIHISHFTLPGAQNKNVISIKAGCIQGLDWTKAIHIWAKNAMVPIPEGSESYTYGPPRRGTAAPRTARPGRRARARTTSRTS
uniref:Uncharacterized protein n=1 Tax=Bionectria ochroleuca TaxID=29856 RepID=A0A8H7N7B9_BIOOC